MGQVPGLKTSIRAGLSSSNTGAGIVKYGVNKTNHSTSSIYSQIYTAWHMTSATVYTKQTIASSIIGRPTHQHQS